MFWVTIGSNTNLHLTLINIFSVLVLGTWLVCRQDSKLLLMSRKQFQYILFWSSSTLCLPCPAILSEVSLESKIWVSVRPLILTTRNMRPVHWLLSLGPHVTSICGIYCSKIQMWNSKSLILGSRSMSSKHGRMFEVFVANKCTFLCNNILARMYEINLWQRITHCVYGKWRKAFGHPHGLC